LLRSSIVKLWVVVLVIFGGVSLAAQVTVGASGDADSGVQIEASVVGQAVSETFDAIVATEAYLALIPEDVKLQSNSYFEGGYWLKLWSFLYGLSIVSILLFSRLSSKMRDVAERITRLPILQPGIYWVQYSLVTAVLGFPLAIYVEYFREHQYGMSNLTLYGWLGEKAIAFGTGLIMMSIAVMVIYSVLRRATKRWWIWGAMTSIALIMFGLMISPIYIAPLTNTYTPLEDEHIRAPIMQMAAAHGVSANEIWVINESAQTKSIGAAVIGMFGTQRITLNDNLLNLGSLATIKLVMAHELGHYVLNQMYYLILAISLLAILAFAFLQFSFDRVLVRWGNHWDIRGVSDVAGVPVMVALLSIFFFFATPVVNTIFRTTEAAADQFGLSVSREPDGLAEAIVLLAGYRKLEPGPIEEFIFYDHPSGRNRILAAMQWKAANIDAIRRQEGTENLSR